MKISHLARAIADATAIIFAKWSVWVKNKKNAKNMRKTILQDCRSCSVQKRAPKNANYSRNETILKIGHVAKAVADAGAMAFAKWSIADAEAIRPFYKNIRVVLYKNPLKKKKKYSKNETILKIGHPAKSIANTKAIGFQNGQSGSKIKNAKNMPKTILQEH